MTKTKRKSWKGIKAEIAMQGRLLAYITRILSNIQKIVHINYNLNDQYETITFKLKREIRFINKKQK